MNEIIQTQTIFSIVDCYCEAQKAVCEAFRLLSVAKERLKGFDIFSQVIPDKCCDYSLDQMPGKASRMIKANTWRFVISKCNMRELLTRTRALELEEMLQTDGLPEISVQSITDFLNNISEQAPDLLMEFVSETFNWLRPPGSEYKTNTEFEIQGKVILDRVIDTSYGMVILDYLYEKNLVSMENTFRLLDGKGMCKYPGDLATKIKDAIKKDRWECENEYFEARWYKKGSLHIRFKRLDLVERLNALAGGNRLKN